MRGGRVRREAKGKEGREGWERGKNEGRLMDGWKG